MCRRPAQSKWASSLKSHRRSCGCTRTSPATAAQSGFRWRKVWPVQVAALWSLGANQATGDRQSTMASSLTTHRRASPLWTSAHVRPTGVPGGCRRWREPAKLPGVARPHRLVSPMGADKLGPIPGHDGALAERGRPTDGSLLGGDSAQRSLAFGLPHARRPAPDAPERIDRVFRDHRVREQPARAEDNRVRRRWCRTRLVTDWYVRIGCGGGRCHAFRQDGWNARDRGRCAMGGGQHGVKRSHPEQQNAGNRRGAPSPRPRRGLRT